ncbi:MAG: hypothetical protein ACK4NS_01045 [Saprospiraceae bacterium]
MYGSCADSPLLPPSPELTRRALLAAGWLERSVAATGGKGSSHSFSPFWGWAGAYPETSGYLIETFFALADRLGLSQFRACAFATADWLLSQQMADGSFPGLLAGSGRPSAFNTAQILFGLLRAADAAAQSAPAARYLHSAERALLWLKAQFEPDYSWRRHTYARGYSPTYHVRALWPMAEAAQRLGDAQALEMARKALALYLTRAQSDGYPLHAGFRPAQAPFTHTLAYAAEGFWHCGVLLGEPRGQEAAVRILDALRRCVERDGRLAGRYGPGWLPDLRFACLTGEAQLSLMWRRVGLVLGREDFLRLADASLGRCIAWQHAGRIPGMRGALPGSAPIWGPYLRFRYPNWGVKFLTDALLERL